jgi:hypothetical protein
MAASTPGPEALQQIVFQFLEGNNDERKAAERQLVKLLKHKECVGALLGQIAGSPSLVVRQLGAILLRKKIAAHWPSLGPTEQQQAQELLLRRLLEEPERLARTAVAHLVSVVAKLTLPNGTWKGLLPFLLQCTQSAEPSHREIAMLLLYVLTDTVSEQMRPHVVALVEVFLGGLADAHTPVRMATLRAVVPVASLIDGEDNARAFFRLVPPVLEALRQCIEMHRKTDEGQYLDVALQVFEVLDDLSQVELEGVGAMLPVLIQSMAAVAVDPKLHAVLRERAATFLGTVATARPGLIVKHGLVEPLVMLSLTILTEQYDQELFDEEEANEAEEEYASPLNFASQLLDALACALPTSRLHPICFSWCRAQILEGRGTPPTMRAALLAISLTCKGCRDPMRKEVPVVLEMLTRCLENGEIPVREAAAVALGQTVEYLQPEILEKYGDFLPQVFKALDDPCPKVRQKSVFTLENVAENLGDRILPHLPALMERLLRLLREGDRKTQRVCLSTISAVVLGVEGAFAPYAPTILSILQQVMVSEAPSDLPLRAKATDCVGVIASAVGRDVFAPYFASFFPLVIRGVSLDNAELGECVFVCLKNFAEAYQEDWAPHLATVMPLVMAAMEEDHGELRPNASPFGQSSVHLEDSEDEESESDDDEVGAGRVLRVRVADLDKKAAAISALGIFAKASRQHFQPYLETSFEKLSDLLQYFHEGVRETVVFALRHLITVVNCLNPPREPWKKGAPQADNLHPQTRKAVDTVMRLLLELAESEDSKEVVKTICDTTAELAKELGPAAIHPHLGRIGELLLALMRGEGTCQTQNEDDDCLGEDEQDHDQILMDAVFETVDEIAKVYGEGFATLWPNFLPVVLGYLSPKRGVSDHAMALGTLAEVTGAMGDAVQPFFKRMFPPMLGMLRSEDGGTRSNAAYGVGLLCQHCPLQATPHFPAILAALQPLLDPASNPPNCVDNACGALARMLASNLDACHFEKVFPAFLERLPLRQDWQENPAVYGTLCSLMIRLPDLLRPYLPRLLPLMCHALQASEVQPEVKAGVADAMRTALSTQEASRQVASSMPPAQQAVLQSLLPP